MTLEDALGDLWEWHAALTAAVRAEAPPVYRSVLFRLDDLAPVDFDDEFKRASSEVHRFALLEVVRVSELVLLAAPEGSADRALLLDSCPAERWLKFLEIVAVETAPRVIALPAVSRWCGEIPGNQQTWRKFLSLRRVDYALRTARPGETRTDTLTRAGVSRRHGYDLMDLLQKVKRRT